MAILLAILDPKHATYDDHPARRYLEQFDCCRAFKFAWLLDTSVDPTVIRDALHGLVDREDDVLVVQLGDRWATHNCLFSGWLEAREPGIDGDAFKPPSPAQRAPTKGLMRL